MLNTHYNTLVLRKYLLRVPGNHCKAGLIRIKSDPKLRPAGFKVKQLNIELLLGAA